MKDAHEITLGNISVTAVHTPGHTPEHMSFLITDGAQASEPGFMLTGDFVFVGDLGRPDLLDESASGVDTRFIRQVDRTSSRAVYELTNAASDVATGVTVKAAETYAAANLLRKLPVDATIHPHEALRFYPSLKLSVVPMSSLRVVWDGGDELVPVTDA